MPLYGRTDKWSEQETQRIGAVSGSRVAKLANGAPDEIQRRLPLRSCGCEWNGTGCHALLRCIEQAGGGIIARRIEYGPVRADDGRFHDGIQWQEGQVGRLGLPRQDLFGQFSGWRDGD